MGSVVIHCDCDCDAKIIAIAVVPYEQGLTFTMCTYNCTLNWSFSYDLLHLLRPFHSPIYINRICLCFFKTYRIPPNSLVTLRFNLVSVKKTVRFLIKRGLSGRVTTYVCNGLISFGVTFEQRVLASLG